jgi:hypothetical protein
VILGHIRRTNSLFQAYNLQFDHHDAYSFVQAADKEKRKRDADTLFVWTYQQNQQPSSSVFLSQQTSE